MVFFFNKRTETKHKDLPPKEDYDELVKLFKRCDVNNDGRLSWEEVKAGFRRLHSRFPLYRTHRAFQMADQNHDGYINQQRPEFLHLTQQFIFISKLFGFHITSSSSSKSQY
ncbi:putative calcium-binding protein CML33 [Gossypium australe]|uniref:Putative calcium-binding protein CML33 n=1 Tax=Gossypium australe TaxID=47621 RepID=A0A5B6UBV3_9ROSI|nr:putative calcium-binding protein CML33 [Gossypium australe]